jgi:predicted Zn-dependent protease
MRNPDEIFGIMLYIHPERRHDVNVWRHELGHIVGLDHDDCCKDSILYPVIQDDIDQVLFQEDIDALKAAYSGFPY